jgi:hypothetical protein
LIQMQFYQTFSLFNKILFYFSTSIWSEIVTKIVRLK